MASTSGGRIRALDTPENLTRSLSSTQRTLVELGGVEDEVAAEELAKIPGVTSVGPSSPHHLWVDSPREIDPRSQIARVVVEKGWQLLTLQSQSMKLEDIFLKVVTSEETPRTSPEEARQEVGGAV